MQLNEAALTLPARRPQGPHRPAIDSGSRPPQSPNQVLRFSFSGPLWLGVSAGQWLLAATEHSFFSSSGAEQMKCRRNTESGDYGFRRSVKSGSGLSVTWFSNEGWRSRSHFFVTEQRLLISPPGRRIVRWRFGGPRCVGSTPAPTGATWRLIGGTRATPAICEYGSFHTPLFDVRGEDVLSL